MTPFGLDKLIQLVEGLQAGGCWVSFRAAPKDGRPLPFAWLSTWQCVIETAGEFSYVGWGETALAPLSVNYVGWGETALAALSDAIAHMPAGVVT